MWGWAGGDKGHQERQPAECILKILTAPVVSQA